uniref:G-protein coupled receptors family 1 profile domain-containing protein n=2 Tax=Monodelphis domestica TaxID=13616 RepID=F6TNL8_MONDO
MPDNATESSVNGSLVPGTPAESEAFAWMSLLTQFIVVVGLVGNTIVLWLLGFRMPRNPFSVYILNLAGADALFLCGQTARFILRCAGYSNLASAMGVIYVINSSYTAGLSLLAAISTERCLSVLFPFWYRSHRPKHTSPGVCAVLWALASLLGVADLIFCVHAHNHHFCPTFFIVRAVWFFLLTAVLCVSSLTLVLRVQCNSQRRRPPRLYLLILLTVLLFLLCGLAPGIKISIRSLYLAFRNHWLPTLLACVNSSLNPLIYFFLGSHSHRKERESLKVVLQRALGDKQELEGEGRNTSHTITPETSSWD